MGLQCAILLRPETFVEQGGSNSRTGESKISTEDFAVAMIDELEALNHVGMRFTVGD